jgi:hypothetical protein
MTQLATDRPKQADPAEQVETIAAALMSWFDSERDGPLEPLEAQVIANDIWSALQRGKRGQSQ